MVRKGFKKAQLELARILFEDWFDYLDRHKIQGRLWICIMSFSAGISIIIFSSLLGYYIGTAAFKMITEICTK